MLVARARAKLGLGPSKLVQVCILVLIETQIEDSFFY